MSALRLGVLASHPIQYHAPVFRELARRCDLTVYFAHRQTPSGQAAAGFGVSFDWDVDLLSGYASGFLENVSRNPGTGRFVGCDTPRVADEIAGGRFDAFLVMGWNLKSYWQAVAACRKARTPVMVRGDSQLATRRNLPTRAMKWLIYPHILRLFDAMLYVGARSREYLDHYKVARSRQFFSPHCVDNDWFRARASGVDRAAARRSLGLPEQDCACLFVGKLLARKRPDDLVRAAARARCPGRRLRVVFAGDGPLREPIRDLAEREGVPATMLGFRNQTELPAIYLACDMLVLPSGPEETWGLVVNEGMAVGLPAIVSEAVGCCPDLIAPGVTGWSHPEGDLDALAGLLERSANMREQADVQEGLRMKMRQYSVPEAAAGMLQAAEAVASRRRADAGCLP